MDDFDRFMAPGGVMDLAQKLKREGKARFIGMSGHEPDVAMRAVESGLLDVLVQGCNVTWSMEQAGKACAGAGVGPVAMKPYAGGELFHPPYSSFLTPVLAISYVLAQPGVCTVIPGAGNVAQLREALGYVSGAGAGGHGQGGRGVQALQAGLRKRIPGHHPMLPDRIRRRSG